MPNNSINGLIPHLIMDIYSIVIELILKGIQALEDDVIFNIQSFGFVKSSNGEIKKIHLSFEVFNNKSSQIFEQMKLVYNSKDLSPKQLFRFVSLGAVDSFKPFYSFILGEKETKEFNVEFESNDEFFLEQNNNVRLELKSSNGIAKFYEFGIVLSEKSLLDIKNIKNDQDVIIFRCDHFKIRASH